MARQRTMEEVAERREAQSAARAARATGRPSAPSSYFAQRMRGLMPLSSDHQGSKRGFSHRPSAAGDIARSKAHTWSVVTGRPLPPAARIRTDKVSNAVPMPHDVRISNYGGQVKFSGAVPGLTPRQRKRARRKLGMQLAGLKIGTAAHNTLADEYLALRPDGTAAD